METEDNKTEPRQHYLFADFWADVKSAWDCYCRDHKVIKHVNGYESFLRGRLVERVEYPPETAKFTYGEGSRPEASSREF